MPGKVRPLKKNLIFICKKALENTGGFFYGSGAKTTGLLFTGK
jgi:hypothetical protein